MAELNISKDKLDILGKLNVMAENLTGAFSLRVDGSPYAKGSSANVTITAKKDLPGIDIRVKAGTKGEKIHIPVILTQTGIKDLVYNDFYIGEDCDVEIVAGCGIHNHGHEDSAHDGIHSFHIGRNSRVFYSEKHYGESAPESGKNIILMADHTKFGVSSPLPFMSFDRLSAIVTDRKPAPEFLTEADRCGIRVLWAEDAGEDGDQ